MQSDGSIQLKIALHPFGSRQTGTARPDSDYDVLLVNADLAHRVVPQPLPHDEPNFYLPSTPVVYHHQKKREWSLELWHKLGGTQTINQFFQLAARKLESQHGPIKPELIDLFLYVPPEMSQQVWAVRLKWQKSNPRIDFASARLLEHAPDHPALTDIQQQILNSDASIHEKALAIETALRDTAGLAPDDEYQRYASLSEIRRNFGRYQEAVAETGLE